MEFFDLCLRSGDKESLEMARKLGFKGVGVIGKGGDFSVAEVKPGRARGMRKKVDVIVSEGREALETPEVDVVWAGGEMNYIMVKIAKRNNVAIGFDFSLLLHSSKRKRGELLAVYFQAAKLVRKYKAPFILTSGAHSPWDLRSPSDLIAFGKVLGFQESECKKALSGRIVKENRKRLEKGVIRGVERA